MLESFTAKKENGISQYKLMVMNPHMDRLSSSSSIDYKIDNNEAWVDQNLKAMQEFYGPANLEKMSPQDFYANYKKFASGTVQL